ncbi:MAG: carbohydrate kinase family protein [Proteobacteria bacterium]|nr:carbohydrate kinase family protein [Pseudomonadota bacterium]MBU4472269.1 carbohydrate kinase family protein [Pseudomonadota bacterium]MCG2751964.1 carbohydrate kinase family protein [Desulfobacteraceae bacterium]
MQIFISGSLAYDRIMDFPGKFEDHILPDKIHVLNVSFVVNGLKENFGGTAGNIAYTLALLGEKPTVLSAVGKDFDRYEKWLLGHGVDLSGVKTIPEEFTAGAYITTDMADNQITGFNPGAMKFASNFALEGRLKDSPVQAMGIVSPGNVEDMLAYSRKYKELNIPYIFDPGQQIPAMESTVIREMIQGAEILISNDYELDLIKKATGFDDSDLFEQTPFIITTLGEKGSVVLFGQGKMDHIPAVKTRKVVDPTGAGDAFRAGLIKGLILQKDLMVAARMGATCAGYVVECYGTQTHRFTLKDFWTRYEENFA